jgi:hypothetical protein
VASTLKLHRNEAVGFIDWLGLSAFQMVATVDLGRLAGRREFKRLNKLARLKSVGSVRASLS